MTAAFAGLIPRSALLVAACLGATLLVVRRRRRAIELEGARRLVQRWRMDPGPGRVAEDADRAVECFADRILRDFGIGDDAPPGRDTGPAAQCELHDPVVGPIPDRRRHCGGRAGS